MKKLQNKKGFTLTEMIVVLAIIGILIALLAPNVARLIQNAQTTSDGAKAKTALTAGLTYGTDAIANGAAVGTGGTLQGAAGSKDAYYVIPLSSSDAAFTAFYYGAGTAPSFMDKTGDSLLPDNTVRGTDVIYYYISSEGAIMGTVSTSKGGVVKAVTGTAPTAVQTALGTTQYTTGDLRKGVIDTTTGEITPAS